jgi:hypothetical protein
MTKASPEPIGYPPRAIFTSVLVVVLSDEQRGGVPTFGTATKFQEKRVVFESAARKAEARSRGSLI